MSPERLLAACNGKKLIVHAGQVFINVRDEEEAKHLQQLGCQVRPWYTPLELEVRGIKQGWEIHLLPALTPIWGQDMNGDEVEVTKDVLLALARAEQGR